MRDGGKRGDSFILPVEARRSGPGRCTWLCFATTSGKADKASNAGFAWQPLNLMLLEGGSDDVNSNS